MDLLERNETLKVFDFTNAMIICNCYTQPNVHILEILKIWFGPISMYSMEKGITFSFFLQTHPFV